MKGKWFIGTKNDDDKQIVKEEFVNSRRTRERLIDILKRDIEALETEMYSASSFETPAWAEYQASRIGEIRALRNVISLLSE